MNKTGIGWTDYTSNPLRYRDAAGRDVWACAKVSAGCTNCYAEQLARRMGRGGPFNAGVTEQLTAFLDAAELHRIRTSRAIAGKKVFLCDMTDVFGDWVPDALIAQLFAAVALRQDVTWQVLTKRPQRMAEQVARLWPLPSVWWGVSVEDQQRADKRIPILAETPAAVRFLSCEPLLGPLNLAPWLWNEGQEPAVDWVIVGGESGPGYRPMQPEWLEDLAYACVGADVPVFVKQSSGNRPGLQGDMPDRIWRLKQFPFAAVPA